jgi:Flp pilus assembly pilin Flp
MRTLLGRLVREEEAQDMIEYALLAAFIAIVVLVGVTALGPVIKTAYDRWRTAQFDFWQMPSCGGC